MKKIYTVLLTALIVCNTTSSFGQDVKEMQENAKAFMLQGDHANAILILNRALQTDPENMETIKNLALNYYMVKDYNKAIEVIKPALDKESSDDQCFQIAGTIYQSLEQIKESEKVYRKGIKKMPESGALYNDLGELLWYTNDANAIKEWEKGIEMDPNYSKNYLNATRFYGGTNNKIWSILYGEIFLNLDPFSNNTPEIKSIVLESYKRLFADVDIVKSNKDKSRFAEAFVATLNKQTQVAGFGINPESLTMIRTRFILDWFTDKASTYSYKLFEYQRQLIQEGLFDAYNQWLFGTVQNLPAYQNWTNSHSTEYADFVKFQKNRFFKLSAGQYYK